MPDFQTNVVSGLLLDLGGPGPLHARLAQALRAVIRERRLVPGVALPPSRVLAGELGCSRWVVTEAYAQLATAGYVEARTGSGTRVLMLDSRVPQSVTSPATAEVTTRIDMAPGLPDLRHFPVGRWAGAIRSAAAALSVADLGHPDSAGHPALRELLCEYLARARGAQGVPADLTVCGSATDGMGRICRSLRRAGCAAVAVEDPGWHRIGGVVAAAGLIPVPVPVDEEGLRIGDIRDAGAVIVTPAHQFPSGVVLSPPRRRALLAWARRAGALVIEDDYDAEFRYDQRPVGTLQGADPSVVALVGSVSKTLSPALGIGWILSPPGLTLALRDSAAPPVLDQLAFASFLRAGFYDRHLRAAAKRYRCRRDALVGELTQRIPQARLSGIPAGLHLVAHLDGVDCELIRQHALELGVRVANLDRYRANAGTEPGLVLGYGNLADHDIGTAVSALAAAIQRGEAYPGMPRKPDFTNQPR